MTSRPPPIPAAGHPADPVLATLRRTFGFDSFRPHQEEAVRALLEGRDVFALLPTGGGKSLCYQLPALLLKGVTVVVSPLIALMKDQVDALTALGVPATFINSSLDRFEAARRQQDVARGAVKLVYVAPERLVMPGFLRLLEAAKPALFAIDEAHCISEWGHDFRPEYRELRNLRGWFPHATLAAFTATATARVQDDIVAQLELADAVQVRGSFNRANLYYDVRPKRSAFDQLVTYLRGHRHASGIIYCQSRNSTETLAEKLQHAGFSAAAYHAGLDADERHRRQEAFTRDDVRIIVATIAFGMGIDKPDVRFVVHYDLPKNLEGYYQESGRAGRDGEPSDCILFYSYGDVSKYQRFIQEISSPAERRVAQQQIKRMADWAAADECRRRTMLAYFDEPYDPASSEDERPKRCCDVCSAGPAVAHEYVDCTGDAKIFLEGAYRTGQKFGVAHVAQVVRGARAQKLTQWGHERLAVFGKGTGKSDAEWRDIARELIREGYLHLAEQEYNAARLTPKAVAAIRNREPILLRLPATPSPRDRPAPDGTRLKARRLEPEPADRTEGGAGDAVLFERLRALRKRLADERTVPPYVIFADATLREMVAARPTSEDELLQIKGVGAAKAQSFGRLFLQSIAAFMAEQGGIAPRLPTPAPAPAGTSTPDAAHGRLSRQVEPPPPAYTAGWDGDPAGAGVAGWVEPPDPAPAPRRALPAGETRRLTLALLREGRDVDAIAVHRQLSLGTIFGHLADAIEAGEEVDVDRIINPDRRRAIATAMAEVGTEPLKPVFERLGEGYLYGELRLVRALLNRDGA